MQLTRSLDHWTRSPIVEAEFRHQRFVIKRGRVGGLWILLAAMLIVPALLYSLFIVLAMPAFDLIYPVVGDWLENLDEEGTVNSLWQLFFALQYISMIAMYPVVTMITLGLAANSINRERQGFTWDSLRLTTIGADRIIIGKWLASLRALNGDHVMVTLLRAGTLASYLLVYKLSLFDVYNTDPVAGYGLTALVLAVLTGLYGLLDAGLSAALGILSSLPQEAAGAVVSSLSMGTRLVTMGAALLWTLLTVHVSIFVGLPAVLLMSVIGMSVYALLIAGTLQLAKWLVNRV